MQDSGEINLFDAEDPTGKKLEYIIFADEKIGIHTFSELYLHVLKSLFATNPDPFFATELLDKLKVTKHAPECRQAAPLNDTYFIEVNLSNPMKLERLKIALTVYDAEDDLIIKYRA